MAKEGRIGDAALRLGLSYHATLRLLLVGQLKGERRNGHWLIDLTDVERFRRARRRAARRAAESVSA
jgi:hypothetical protein